MPHLLRYMEQTNLEVKMLFDAERTGDSFHREDPVDFLLRPSRVTAAGLIETYGAPEEHNQDTTTLTFSGLYKVTIDQSDENHQEELEKDPEDYFREESSEKIEIQKIERID